MQSLLVIAPRKIMHYLCVACLTLCSSFLLAEEKPTQPNSEAKKPTSEKREEQRKLKMAEQAKRQQEAEAKKATDKSTKVMEAAKLAAEQAANAERKKKAEVEKKAELVKMEAKKRQEAEVKKIATPKTLKSQSENNIEKPVKKDAHVEQAKQQHAQIVELLKQIYASVVVIRDSARTQTQPVPLQAKEASEAAEINPRLLHHVEKLTAEVKEHAAMLEKLRDQCQEKCATHATAIEALRKEHHAVLDKATKVIEELHDRSEALQKKVLELEKDLQQTKKQLRSEARLPLEETPESANVLQLRDANLVEVVRGEKNELKKASIVEIFRGDQYLGRIVVRDQDASIPIQASANNTPAH